jgi:hypothetical protein
LIHERGSEGGKARAGKLTSEQTEKTALISWIDRHQGEYGRGLLDGFQAED